MFRREGSQWLSFCASLLTHALLALALFQKALREPIYFPPLPMNRAGMNGPLIPIVVKEEDAADLRASRFGEADGQGTAINSATGELPLIGKQGDQEQAWLSRDPVGPGPMPEEPSLSTALPGEGGTGGRKLPASVQSSNQPSAIGTMAAAAPVPRIVLRAPPPEPDGPGEMIPTTQPIAVAMVQEPASSVPPMSTPEKAAGGHGGRPGAPIAPADPAPMSDSESDAFTRVGSAIVRGGKIEAQLGRAHKLIKPRLTTKAQLDLLSIIDPRVVLKVSVDDSGKVTDVQVLRSSGSNEIDLPTELALYKSWIEPGKDAAGKPAPDVIILTVAWR